MPFLQYYESETPKFVCTLTDGATDQYPQAKVYNYDLTLKETVDLTHNAGGQYLGNASGSYDKGNYSVVYKVYSDSGHTTPNTDYWIGEDNLDVIYHQSGGFVSSGGSLNVDWDRLIDRIWEHKTAKKILELLEKIKGFVSKITDNKIITAIKSIKLPEFPKMPEPEKVDFKPILAKIDEVMLTMTASVNNIKLPEFPEIPNPEDYGFTLNEIIRLLEKIDKNDQSLEIYNLLEEVKGNKDILKNLEDIKKLLKKK